MQSFKMKSGYEIPQLGFGTWELTGSNCRKAIPVALDIGYTHIDTAAMYGNEKEIGAGLKDAGADRSKLFITSKVPYRRLHHDQVIGQCEQSLRDIGTDYFDLYLIHWPNSSVPMDETFDAMAELVEQGKVRSIGVSNFTVAHLKEAQKASSIPISVNQVEFHPMLNQEDLLRYCKENKIVMTGYSPLAHGYIFENAVLASIAQKSGKTVAQVSIRWVLQKGMVTIPKATSETHIRQNFEALSFWLSDESMEALNTMGQQKRVVNPEWAEFDKEYARV
ncbi:MAG: aldo/keto reductase [Chitinivibrionales bacterium]